MQDSHMVAEPTSRTTRLLRRRWDKSKQMVIDSTAELEQLMEQANEEESDKRTMSMKMAVCKRKLQKQFHTLRDENDQLEELVLSDDEALESVDHVNGIIQHASNKIMEWEFSFDCSEITSLVATQQNCSAATGSHCNHNHPRLPTLQIPEFDGDLEKWTSFWSAFDRIINQNDKLTDVEKFEYLVSKLTGAAGNCLEGMPRTPKHYKEAITILLARFGNTKLLMDRHYICLNKLSPCNGDVRNLRHLYDEFQKHIRCLTAMGEDTNGRHFIHYYDQNYLKI